MDRLFNKSDVETTANMTKRIFNKYSFAAALLLISSNSFALHPEQREVAGQISRGICELYSQLATYHFSKDPMLPRRVTWDVNLRNRLMQQFGFLISDPKAMDFMQIYQSSLEGKPSEVIHTEILQTFESMQSLIQVFKNLRDPNYLSEYRINRLANQFSGLQIDSSPEAEAEASVNDPQLSLVVTSLEHLFQQTLQIRE